MDNLRASAEAGWTNRRSYRNDPAQGPMTWPCPDFPPDQVRIVDSATGEVLAEGLRALTPYEQLRRDYIGQNEAFQFNYRAHYRWACPCCDRDLPMDGSEGPYFFAYDPLSDGHGQGWCRHCAITRNG
jgi:hypothetical protein